MGSFRSSPDNVKHSSTGSGNGLQYAVTHMCGRTLLRQVGGYTWKTPISHNYSQINKAISLQSSMDMAVSLPLM